ncbi:hypothetical protein ACRAWF_36755 [Streptomyces sp. L7]
MPPDAEPPEFWGVPGPEDERRAVVGARRCAAAPRCCAAPCPAPGPDRPLHGTLISTRCAGPDVDLRQDAPAALQAPGRPSSGLHRRRGRDRLQRPGPATRLAAAARDGVDLRLRTARLRQGAAALGAGARRPPPPATSPRRSPCAAGPPTPTSPTGPAPCPPGAARGGHPRAGPEARPAATDRAADAVPDAEGTDRRAHPAATNPLHALLITRPARLGPGLPARSPPTGPPGAPSPAALGHRPGAGAPGPARRVAQVAGCGRPRPGRSHSGTAATPARQSHELPGGGLRPRLTSFVGREPEIAAIRSEVHGARLVTLTGPGAPERPVSPRKPPPGSAQAWLVELARLDRPEAVPGAVVSALGLRETVLMTTELAVPQDDPVALLIGVLRGAQPTPDP